MRVRVGTSGFSYKEWKGPFYPADLPDREMLRWYATRLDAVEINNTFYRMPREEMLRGWAERVPPDFCFALKASRRITHHQRLEGCEESLGYLLRGAAALGERLGPILYQLPPTQRKDIERLRAFLALLPPGSRAALEFRHPSWHDDEVTALLGQHGAALVLADTEDASPTPPLVPTARFGYLRLRRGAYDRPALESWSERIAAQDWDEAFVFFLHDEEARGPRDAQAFRELLGTMA